MKSSIEVPVTGQSLGVGSGVILLNALVIGIQADQEARGKQSAGIVFQSIERIFCLIFSFELSVRIYAYRLDFFFNNEWKWNVFDIILVGIQLFEEIVSIFQVCYALVEFRCLWEDPGKDLIIGGTVFRIVRLLRMLRVTRLLRILRMIGELRTMVYCLIKSMRSLLWTAMLLFLLIYMIGVFLTKLVADHLQADSTGPYAEFLRETYGSLFGSLFSLFQAITGGADWRDLVTPLMEGIHPALGVLYASYIGFAVLAMMNVITGVFVESVILSTKEAKDIQLLNTMRHVFQEVDADKSGMMDYDEFEKQCNSKEMLELFREINVEQTDAKGLFRLLDVDSTGTIHAEDFLSGCFRLRGPAKALDLEILLREFVRWEQKQTAHLREVQAALLKIEGSMGASEK